MNTPNGGSSIVRPCEHEYEFLYSSFDSSEGSHSDHYEQKDTFFCRKCLAYETKLVRSETSRGRPKWYKG